MSARRKILMLTTQLGYGGAETSFIRLANFLARSMDVTVALFTSDYGMESYTKGHEPLNAKIILLDKPGAGRLRRWLRRIATVRTLKRNADATISFLSGPNLVNVLAGSNVRSIVSLRGSRIYDPVSPTSQRLLFRHLFDPVIFYLAARIMPVSTGLVNEIGHAARAKAHPVPPFIEPMLVQQKVHEPAPAAYASLKGQPVIIGVGRLSVEKGFHHLIRIFAQLAVSRPGAKLLLVGDGPQREDLRALCKNKGLAMDDTVVGVTAVLFAGYQKEVLPLMALARVFALTSATEGFPSVLLEAMVAGVPVVAADTPWGARTILGGDDTTAQPYPTHVPTQARYGTLMPRIDREDHEHLWVHTLGEFLEGTRAAPAEAASRPLDFEIAKIGAEWERVIEGVAS